MTRPFSWNRAAALLAALPFAAPEPNTPLPLGYLDKPHEIELVFFVPSDREPIEGWREKVEVVLTFVADVYRQSLSEHGLEGGGLDFRFAEGALDVRLLRGEHAAAHYSKAPDYDGYHQWNTVVPEVEAAMGSAREHLYVIFAETWDDGPSGHEWPGGVALGSRYSASGGVGLFSAWILQDLFTARTVEEQLVLFADETPVPGRTALGHGREGSPRFEFIEDGFGAVAHELGHALGLPHDLRDDRRFVMGNGFRRLRELWLDEQPRVGFSEPNAALLLGTRFLTSAKLTGDDEPPKVDVRLARQPKVGAPKLQVIGSARDDGGLAAVNYFLESTGTVVGGGALKGRRKSLKTTLRVDALEAGETKLVVLVSDREGNVAREELELKVR